MQSVEQIWLIISLFKLFWVSVDVQIMLLVWFLFSNHEFFRCTAQLGTSISSTIYHFLQQLLVQSSAKQNMFGWNIFLVLFQLCRQVTANIFKLNLFTLLSTSSNLLLCKLIVNVTAKSGSFYKWSFKFILITCSQF